MKKYTLDPEEQAIFDAFNRGEFRVAKDSEKLKKQLRQAAMYTKKKKQQVNLRLSALTVKKIKAKAMVEGIPYQTLIDSILHKYVTGVIG